MQRIPLEKAKPGMVVAKPVANDTGVVLIGAGTELTEAAIEKLKGLEIPCVIIKGRPLDTGTPEKPLEQLFAELDERFTLVAGDKLCMQIRDMIKKDLKLRREET
jgi:hypothetical protein